MSFRFDPARGLIIVRARLQGPAGDAIARLALDTGATGTVINRDIVAHEGNDVVSAPERVSMTTGSRVESAPRIQVERIEALGQERRDFPIVCHTLPPTIAIDGLLGLDFLRGLRLAVDFRTGLVSIA